MTIEERVEWCLDQRGGRPLFGDEARVIIAQALRDQIEDCAQIADAVGEEQTDMASWPDAARYVASRGEIAQSIADEIRALAGEKEKGEGE